MNNNRDKEKQVILDINKDKSSNIGVDRGLTNNQNITNENKIENLESVTTNRETQIFTQSIPAQTEKVKEKVIKQKPFNIIIKEKDKSQSTTIFQPVKSDRSQILGKIII